MESGRATTRRQARGFTLIEIMVVLGIAAVVSAITFSAYSEMSASHKRVTCQGNLQQVYIGMRQYMGDYTDVPYYDPANVLGRGNGIGLWLLYTYRDPATNKPCDYGDTLIERYLRKASLLHCPRDSNSGHNVLLPNGGKVFNTNYVSYQIVDDDGTNTYAPIRTTTSTDPFFKRQLLIYSGSTRVRRPPDDDTIVTWCQWHRKGAGGRNFDNVLFYDGTVQFVANEAPTTPSYQRTPKPPT